MSEEKLKTFFCLAPSLQGTTAAMIKAKNLKQAHFIYTNHVVIPSKRKKGRDFYDPDAVMKKGEAAGLAYWNGWYYIEQLKVWKKFRKKYPIAPIAMQLNIEITKGRAQYDEELKDDK